MRRTLAAPLALVAALALSPALLSALPSKAPPASRPAAATASGPAGTESGGDFGAFTVYLPQPVARPAQPAARRAQPPGESGLAVALAAALFAAAGVAWIGFRTPVCPRCRQKLVRLERQGSAASHVEAGAGVDAGAGTDAVGPIEDWIDGARRDPWACLGCGLVMRRRFGSLAAADDRCPSCGSPTKKTRLEVRERPGYLTWGEVRLDEECLSCAHRTGALYAAPPLEAPTTRGGSAPRPERRPLSRSSR
jgi:hypothetical protein